MAFTQTPLTTASIATNTVLTTGSIAPTAAARQFLAIGALDFTGPPTPPSPTILGNSLTWSLVRARPDLDQFYWIWLYQAHGTPTSGTVQLTFPHSMDRIAVSAFEVAGEGGIVQSTDRRFPEEVSSITTTLGAFAVPEHATFGAVVIGRTSATVSPGAGFTEIHQVSLSNLTLFVEWQAAADTSVDCSWAAGDASGAAIAWEVALATGETGQGPRRRGGVPGMSTTALPLVRGGVW